MGKESEIKVITSNDLPEFSNSSMLNATSQLCETIGSGSLENSCSNAMLCSSDSSQASQGQGSK